MKELPISKEALKNREDVLAEYRRKGLPEKFCSVPFTTLLLEPDGLVGGCRQKGCEFPMGRLQDNTLMEIWNGEKIRQWRREFLEGKPIICQKEVRHYSCHSCPEYNSLLPEVDISEFQTKKPSRIAFNLNGKCNLECRMCHVWEKPNGLYDKIGFWQQIDDIIENLKEVELLSGEPFIQKDTYKLMDLISVKKPDARWIITTNANWKLTDFVRSKMDKVHFRNLIVSLDSLVPGNYAKIRKKGDLDLALSTLDDLLDYEQDRIKRGLSPLNIRINFLVQKDNWQELADFHTFKKNKKVEIFRTFLYEPFEHSLLSLPEAERERILNFYMENLKPEQVAFRVILPLLDSLAPIYRAQYYDWLKGVPKASSLTSANTEFESRF